MSDVYVFHRGGFLRLQEYQSKYCVVEYIYGAQNTPSNHMFNDKKTALDYMSEYASRVGICFDQKIS